VSRILWVRSGHNEEEARALEEQTGLRVAVAVGLPAASRGMKDHSRALLIELPLEAETFEKTLAEAYDSPNLLPVVIYDKEGGLDESLIRPDVMPFRHVRGRRTVEELGAAIGSVVTQAAQHPRNNGRSEPWRDLLIGESRPVRDLHSMIRLVAPRQSTILITGETGTGKEVVARAIHMASKRSAGRLVSLNCAAIPESLVEAELFGHAKGAFTGAINDRMGCFEQANRGTIFLDEVGEMPLEVQPKLLRVLQEREFQRVGGSGTTQIDTRVIAASNTDLRAAVGAKRFREDLLYRLNVVPIHVPPLRARASDIPLLAEHFIEKCCRREELELKQLSQNALRRLMDYEWPGNVRQLEHAIEMAVTLAGDRDRLYSGDIRLPDPVRLAATGDEEIQVPTSGLNYEEVIGRVEKLLLQQALRSCGGNKAKAANILGLKRTTLIYKVKALEACTI
jgi:transcriptional regulator with GAF, ATPase, and Fis domain